MDHELPAHPDLDFYRKDAKSLVRACRAGESKAVQRAENVLGARARRFVLSDAQYVIASEHGFGSWAEFRRAVESAERGASEVEDERLAARREALAAARMTWGERGEVVLDAGLTYEGSEPVRILVRKRSHRYDIHDQGAAVRFAGKPPGWLEVAQRVAKDEGLNVSRQGVAFVGVVEGRDVALLAWRIAALSLAVYQELLELRP